MLARASFALSSRVSFLDEINQRTIWEQNSTAIPTVITKFTKDTALALIPANDMTPPMLTRIINTTEMIIKAPQILSPNIATVTRKTATARKNISIHTSIIS